MTSITITIYYVLAISYIIFLYKKYRLCPELIWIIMQLLMFFGIVNNADISNQNDKELIGLYLIALITFIATNFIFRAFNKPNGSIKITNDIRKYNKRKKLLITTIVICIIISATFFASGGGNVFINGLKSIAAGETPSIKYSRMKLLSMSGVGYVYQLRVIVLPLSVLYYVLINKKKPSSIILTIISILLLIGTGQRGGLVSISAITIITIYYISSNRREKPKKKKGRAKTYLAVILMTLALFSLSTIMNGRSAESGNTSAAITQRLFSDNQISAIKGFRYIKTQEIQNGKDWGQQLLDILPGKNSYVSLDTRIFSYIYGGSMDGTSPPCIWGSSYYNLGLFGVILMSLIVSYIITKIHKKFSRKECDILDIIIYSALQFLVAYWVTSGPVSLFNNGFITVIILYMFYDIPLKMKNKKQDE